MLAIAQPASAGGTSGAALTQAAQIFLSFPAPNLNFVGGTQLQGIGPDNGSQTFPGSFEISDPSSTTSSAVATSGTLSADRTATGVGASAQVDGLQLDLLGKSVVSATSISSSVTCPTGEVVNLAAAQAIGLRLGDAAPVDLSAGQGATGSTTITDDAGQAYSVEIQASVFAATPQDASAGLNLIITIGNVYGTADFALTNCAKPLEPGAEEPGPEGPDDGLADSGTGTALVAALLGVVLVAGGGTAVLWVRSTPERRVTRRSTPT